MTEITYALAARIEDEETGNSMILEGAKLPLAPGEIQNDCLIPSVISLSREFAIKGI